MLIDNFFDRLNLVILRPGFVYGPYTNYGISTFLCCHLSHPTLILVVHSCFRDHCLVCLWISQETLQVSVRVSKVEGTVDAYERFLGGHLEKTQ